ncbi:MAG: hypothetical protein AB1921_18240 [Thermodesulfobacteriota bacterium]
MRVRTCPEPTVFNKMLTGRRLGFVLLSLFLLLGLLPASPAGAADSWELAPGLSVVRYKPDRNLFSGNLNIVVLKIDPSRYDFTVESVSRPNSEPGTLREWARRKRLSACINASMYREDGRTSTGLLRDREMVNNSRINKRFGAFFVFHPQGEGLAPVAILDRYVHKDWEERLSRYRSAVQNYRMIGADGLPAWPEGGDPTCIAAVGMDRKGMVLFIFSEAPFTPRGLSDELLALPLDLTALMYSEGGPPAGLFVSAGGTEEFWTAGLQGALVPSVLGIRPKEGNAGGGK